MIKQERNFKYEINESRWRQEVCNGMGMMQDDALVISL